MASYFTSKEMLMNTVKIRHGLGPVSTTDAVNDSRLGDMALVEIEVAQGAQFDPGDRAKVRAILDRYTSGGAVNAGAATRLGDAVDAERAGREAGAKVRANIENNARINKVRTDFWNEKTEELIDSIRR